MSYLAFHADADKALAGKFWGIKLQDENGNLRDSGVQEFVETLLQILSSLGPIELHRPLEFINRTNGPAMKIYNTGDVDWQGIRLRDNQGNESQLGIGLGNEGITANNLIPDPRYSIDPDDAHRFHSSTGGNAGGDREHPKAIEADNGLLGAEYLINNFTVPFWDFFQQPQPGGDVCGQTFYTWNLIRGEELVIPTYVPAAPLIRATADANINKGESGTVTDDEGEQYTVENPLFLCIVSGDEVVISCIGGSFVVIATEEHKLFTTGTTTTAIPKGGSGSVDIGGEIVNAQSPLDSLTCDITVALSRESGCDGWTVHGSECWDTDMC